MMNHCSYLDCAHRNWELPFEKINNHQLAADAIIENEKVNAINDYNKVNSELEQGSNYLTSDFSL